MLLLGTLLLRALAKRSISSFVSRRNSVKRFYVSTDFFGFNGRRPNWFSKRAM